MFGHGCTLWFLFSRSLRENMADGGRKKLEKRKTKTYMRELNPTFNEAFTFNVSMHQIRETSLLVTVMDYDKIGRNVS